MKKMKLNNTLLIIAFMKFAKFEHSIIIFYRYIMNKNFTNLQIYNKYY